MRVAIICLRGKSAAPEDQWAAKRARRLAALDEAQALGIARAMRDRDASRPCLYSKRAAPLSKRPWNMAFPVCCGVFFRVFSSGAGSANIPG